MLGPTRPAPTFLKSFRASRYTVGVKAVFLSDAHLQAPSAPNFQRLLRFFEQLPIGLDLLVINGDFFDAYYGDNKAAERLYGPMLDALVRLRREGTRIVYVEGNHDFRLATALGRRDFEVMSEVWQTTLAGRRILVMHGDLITGDRWYKLLHFALRTPLVMGLDAVVPDALSLRIALGMSQASRVRPREHEAPIRQKLLSYARTLEGIDIFITGHTHYPLDEVVLSPNGPVRVINLGDWVENFTYLWVEDDVWELRRA